MTNSMKIIYQTLILVTQNAKKASVSLIQNNKTQTVKPNNNIGRVNKIYICTIYFDSSIPLEL